MKAFKVTLLAALISSPLAAETIDKTWEVGVFGDYIKSSTNKEDKAGWDNIQEGKGWGVDLQKIINEKWNARIEAASTYYAIQNGNESNYGIRYGIDAIYKLEDSQIEDTDFYLFSGVKRFNNAKSYNAVNIGAGFSHQVTDRFSFFGEAVIYRDVNYGYTDQGFKLGLKYAFGEAKKSVAVSKPVEKAVLATAAALAVTAVDTDNDGISDENDHCNNTPANVKVDSKGCTLFSEKAVQIDLNVPFGNNSAQLEAAAMNDIQHLADFMNEYKSTNVVIEGHSSAVGSSKYNLTLSQKRADAVKSVLVNKFNIEESRLASQGLGETQLISNGNSKADHEMNRRVVAKIVATVQNEMQKD